MGLDAIREMDHIPAAKSFKGGSHLQSVLTKLACVDILAQSQQSRKLTHANHATTGKHRKDDTISYLGQKFTHADIKKIVPVCLSMHEQGGFRNLARTVAVNLYDRTKKELPSTASDKNSLDAGRYLMYKFLATEQWKIFVCQDL